MEAESQIISLSDEHNLSEERFLRNKDLIPQNKLDDVTVIGAGGIGSALVMNAAIMGFKHIRIWDHDTLELHNLSTTTYPTHHLYTPKAIAAKEQAKAYGAHEVTTHVKPWRPGDELSNKVFMGPDNMEVRRNVYETWKQNPRREFLIDMRMGALSMEIVTVTKEEDHFMEDWLASDDISDESCTAKHTIFTASVSSGLGLTQAFKVLSNRPYYAYIWMSLSPISLRRKYLKKNN
jgi:hypothetical protein